MQEVPGFQMDCLSDDELDVLAKIHSEEIGIFVTSKIVAGSAARPLMYALARTLVSWIVMLAPRKGEADEAWIEFWVNKIRTEAKFLVGERRKFRGPHHGR